MREGKRFFNLGDSNELFTVNTEGKWACCLYSVAGLVSFKCVIVAATVNKHSWLISNSCQNLVRLVTQAGRIKSIKVGLHSRVQVAQSFGLRSGDACLISNLPVICSLHGRPCVRPHGLVDVPLSTTAKRPWSVTPPQPQHMSRPIIGGKQGIPNILSDSDSLQHHSGRCYFGSWLSLILMTCLINWLNERLDFPLPWFAINHLSTDLKSKRERERDAAAWEGTRIHEKV